MNKRDGEIVRLGKKEVKMFEKWNERVKNLSFVDIKLIKWAVFFTTIIIVKLFPQLLKIDYWVLIVLMILCSIKPVYKFWIKK